MAEEKLTKKQRKALEFKNKTAEERKEDKAEKVERKRKLEEEEAAQAPKKRKTRRGKKGKGVNNGTGPRFILFVGNLPYDIQQAELVSHFKAANPDRIRLRADKGIAFLEFDNDNQEIQSKMEVALRMHHLTLRERKINVELTVGGGGNLKFRLEKIKSKNDKMNQDRNEKIRKTITTKKDAKEKSAEPSPAPTGGIHPDRARMIG